MVDRSRPQLLFLAHRVPYPPDKGDRIRSFHLLKSLARRAVLHLACLADEPVPEETVAALRCYCERVAVVRLTGWSRWARVLGALLRGRTVTAAAFSSPGLRKVLRIWTQETRFHAVLVTASSMVPYLRLPGLRNLPAVVDLMDVDSQKWFDYAASQWGPRAWLYRTEGRRLRALEKDLPAWAKAVTLVSEAEAELYRQFCAAGTVRAVPNGVDLDYFRPGTEPMDLSCVFVGALDYRPNVDGACWFCKDVWPRILRRRPEARMYLVGRRPVPAVRRLAALPGVDVVGQVADVRPFLARATLALVPLRLARGLQNKVLEALAMGKPTIASPQSLAGVAAKSGVHLLQASSAEEWVHAVLTLFDQPELRRQLGKAGRNYVEEHHHWDSCLEPFPRLLGLVREEEDAPQVPADPPLGKELGRDGSDLRR